MRLVVVSVFDRAVQAFGRPVFVNATGQAVRSFRDEVNNPEGEMRKHPGDYELFSLGHFNDENGRFDVGSQDGPVLLVRGEDCVEVKRVS